MIKKWFVPRLRVRRFPEIPSSPNPKKSLFLFFSHLPPSSFQLVRLRRLNLELDSVPQPCGNGAPQGGALPKMLVPLDSVSSWVRFVAAFFFWRWSDLENHRQNQR